MTKKLLIIVCACIFGLCATSKAQSIMTNEQKASYALGANFGEQLKGAGIDVDIDAFVQGFKEAFAGKNQFSQEQMQEAFGYVDSMARSGQEKMVQVQKAEGAAFLAKNKKEAGVKETASGLQYKVITEGTGKKPTAADQVKVHYTGKLLDGTVFDSSVERGEPITFPLSQVIPGWTEGLQLMSEGSKYILYIPSDLGYGDRGAGAQIKPGATLVFEVELIEVNPK